MSKKVNRTNWRVVIYPVDHVYLGASGRPSEQITCDDIVKEVKRHIDDVASVHAEWDDEPVCEHCGWAWTEDSPDFNGGCCDADLANDPTPAPDASPSASSAPAAVAVPSTSALATDGADRGEQS
jgi:hypothetical protein